MAANFPPLLSNTCQKEELPAFLQQILPACTAFWRPSPARRAGKLGASLSLSFGPLWSSAAVVAARELRRRNVLEVNQNCERRQSSRLMNLRWWCSLPTVFHHTLVIPTERPNGPTLQILQPRHSLFSIPSTTRASRRSLTLKVRLHVSTADP